MSKRSGRGGSLSSNDGLPYPPLDGPCLAFAVPYRRTARPTYITPLSSSPSDRRTWLAVPVLGPPPGRPVPTYL